MLCDRCGKPSVYHSTLIVNGVSQTTNLCRECVIKEGVFNDSSSIFDDMFSVFSDFLPFEEFKDVSCPVCKTTLREFRASGKLGCPNCYEVFNEEIKDVVKKISQHEKHKAEAINVNKSKKQTKQEQIDVLRQEMKKAVEEERYEDAGKLKKQIKKLEGENE